MPEPSGAGPRARARAARLRLALLGLRPYRPLCHCHTQDKEKRTGLVLLLGQRFNVPTELVHAHLLLLDHTDDERVHLGRRGVAVATRPAHGAAR